MAEILKWIISNIALIDIISLNHQFSHTFIAFNLSGEVRNFPPDDVSGCKFTSIRILEQ